jgi:hypothetical protein
MTRRRRAATRRASTGPAARPQRAPHAAGRDEQAAKHGHASEPGVLVVRQHRHQRRTPGTDTPHTSIFPLDTDATQSSHAR